MRLIIDTDCGIDDAEALIMALTHPDASVEAITTVSGNVHLDKVNRNVATVLQQTGASVPFYSGSADSLIAGWGEDASSFHQEDGLGDWDDRPPCDLLPEDEHAVMALLRLVNESPGEYTLVALGPLTNIALAVRLDPDFPQKLKSFTWMGGAVDAHGNTPVVTAEFNCYYDPEAAHIVLSAFPMTTLLGWEATVDHMIPAENYRRFIEMGTPLSRFFEGITTKTRLRLTRMYDGHLLPDPLAMAVTLQPEIIEESELRHITVELEGKYTRGQTVVNYTLYHSGEPNVKIIRRLDLDAVIAMYEKMLS